MEDHCIKCNLRFSGRVLRSYADPDLCDKCINNKIYDYMNDYDDKIEDILGMIKNENNSN